MKSKNKEYWEILLIIPAAFLISNSSISSAQFMSQSETHELNFAGNPTHFNRYWTIALFKRFDIIFSTSYSISADFMNATESNWIYLTFTCTNKIWRIVHVIFYRWHFYRIFRASKFFASFTSHTVVYYFEHFWITSHGRENW